MRKISWLLLVLVQFLIVSPVSAHRPEQGLDLGITDIPDGQTSYAYYRELTEETPFHVYRIELTAGEFYHAGINIPQIARFEDYHVDMMLIGQGLPVTTDENFIPVSGADSPLGQLLGEAVDSAFDLAGEDAGSVYAPSEISEPFFEPFTQTNYWGRQVLELTVPQSGTYYLLIWSPDGQSGKYVLDSGTEEVFGVADIFRFPGWWLETRLYFEQGPTLAFYSALSLIAIVALYIFRRSRRRAAVSA